MNFYIIVINCIIIEVINGRRESNDNENIKKAIEKQALILIFYLYVCNTLSGYIMSSNITDNNRWNEITHFSQTFLTDTGMI